MIIGTGLARLACLAFLLTAAFASPPLQPRRRPDSRPRPRSPSPPPSPHPCARRAASTRSWRRPAFPEPSSAAARRRRRPCRLWLDQRGRAGLHAGLPLPQRRFQRGSPAGRRGRHRHELVTGPSSARHARRRSTPAAAAPGGCRTTCTGTISTVAAPSPAPRASASAAAKSWERGTAERSARRVIPPLQGRG